MSKRLLVPALLFATAALMHAEVRLPAVFSDHMVLQRGAKAPVWGWAIPGEQVTVAIAGQTHKATAGADSKWMLRLDPLQSKEPLRMTVKASNIITVADILVGEVWLCSGQSNMAMRVSAARDFEQERAKANYPRIRAFTVAAAPAKQPQPDVKGSWVEASPDTVGQFTAAGYFFARELHEKLSVPVGLINSSVGGTAIDLWISEEAQRSAPELRPAITAVEKQVAEFDRDAAAQKHDAALAKWKKAAAEAKRAGKAAPRPPADPVAAFDRKTSLGTLFNGMIAPLVPFALRGGLWYQGEANSTPDRAAYYRYQLPLLIKDWRARWGQGEFPFAWVQLPNFEGPGRNWPLVREGMLKSLAVPNTGMAITIDIGEPGNIHPKNKQDAGKRLAMWALGTVYGRKMETSGPLPGKAAIAGGRVTIPFTHTSGGLAARGGSLRGFEIAGADRNWVKAEAAISGNRVVVSSPSVKSPVAVRYAWSNNPDCNLYNGAGLPATPFRTDDWE